MNKRVLFFTLLLLVIPALVWADASDDDTWYDDDTWTDDDTYFDDDTSTDDDTFEPTCEGFCAAVDSCQTECITGDCVSFCEDSNTQALLECLNVADCASFNDCVCNGGTGDDDAGGIADDDNDAATDDDDDDNDSGCSVSNSQSGFALTFVMLGIGLAALIISLRPRRKA